MKIALIRGPYVNRFELQNWEPLTKDHEIKVFYPNNNFFDVSEIKLPKEEVKTYESILGKKISDYLRIPFHFPFGYYHGIPGLEKKLKDFDIVHGVESFYIFDRQIIRAKKKYGLRAVFTIWENIPFAHEQMPFLRQCKKEVLEGADLFVAISERAKTALMLEGVKEERIVVIPMGIDLKGFRPGKKDKKLLKKLRLKKEDFIILFVGRLTPEKGVLELLNAFSLAIKKINHAKLLLVGSGPLEGKIKSQAQRLGIFKKIRLATFPYSQMPAVHRLADIFVLPSLPIKGWQEQQGMVLVEAMATGVPVITTLSGSIEEIVGQGGLLIQPADSYSLYQTILQIYNDKDLKQALIKKGLEQAKKFDRQIIAQRLENAYKKIA
jgi:glycosyltransferase involved in cell wall biosynthesis